MRYLWSALSASARLFTVFAWLVLLTAVLAVSTAHAQTPRTATITFIAPTQHTDNSAITGALSYDVYQGLKGGSKSKVGTINGTSTTISSGLLGGKEYCFAIVVIEAGVSTPSVMSADTANSCKAFDQSGPNTVTITVT